MRCSKCGAENKGKINFCKQCGAKVEASKSMRDKLIEKSKEPFKVIMISGIAALGLLLALIIKILWHSEEKLSATESQEYIKQDIAYEKDVLVNTEEVDDYDESHKKYREVPEALQYLGIGNPYYDWENGVLVVPDNNIFNLISKDLENATGIEKEEMEDFYWQYYTTGIDSFADIDYFLSLYFNEWHELQKVEFLYENVICPEEYGTLYWYVDFYGDNYSITNDGNFIWKLEEQEICLEWDYVEMRPIRVVISEK